jgi:hypothetical protein
MAWYRAGTVTVNNGDTLIVGAGTSFLTTIKAGDIFVGPDNLLYEIDTVVSTTQFTIKTPYGGESAVGASYEIIPTTSYLKTLASQVTDLIALYQGVPQNTTDAQAAAAEAQAARDAAIQAKQDLEDARDAAELYKNQASDAATAAKNSETNAAQSETNAKQSETNAESAAERAEAAAVTVANVKSVNGRDGAIVLTGADVGISPMFTGDITLMPETLEEDDDVKITLARQLDTNPASLRSTVPVTGTAWQLDLGDGTTQDRARLMRKDPGNQYTLYPVWSVDRNTGSTRFINPLAGSAPLMTFSRNDTSEAVSLCFNTTVGALDNCKYDLHWEPGDVFGLRLFDSSFSNPAYVWSVDPASGSVTFQNSPMVKPTAAHAQIVLANAGAGFYNRILGTTGDGVTKRWALDVGYGANLDFSLTRYDDTGAKLDQPLYVERGTGNITMGGGNPSTTQVWLSGKGNQLVFNKPATTDPAQIVAKANNVTQWSVELGDTTAGNLSVTRYDGAGAKIDQPLVVDPSNGRVSVGKGNTGTALFWMSGKSNTLVMDRTTNADTHAIVSATGGIAQWGIDMGCSTNAGARPGHFAIDRYNPATGAYVDTPMNINPTTGVANFKTGFAVGPNGTDMCADATVYTSPVYVQGTSTAFPGASATCRYAKLGRWVFFVCGINIPDASIAPNSVISINMPYAAVYTMVYAGRNNSVGGSMMQVVHSSGQYQAVVFKYDNTGAGVGVTNAGIIFSGCFLATA